MAWVVHWQQVVSQQVAQAKAGYREARHTPFVPAVGCGNDSRLPVLGRNTGSGPIATLSEYHAGL